MAVPGQGWAGLLHDDAIAAFGALDFGFAAQLLRELFGGLRAGFRRGRDRRRRGLDFFLHSGRPFLVGFVGEFAGDDSAGAKANGEEDDFSELHNVVCLSVVCFLLVGLRRERRGRN